MVPRLATAFTVSEFAADVRYGLTRPGQKELHSKYLYDDVGTALFEVITRLPEYGLTRAGERLLRRHAPDLVELLPGDPLAVAELGSGTGKKTRRLLETLAARWPTTYYPIDISPAALELCRLEFVLMPAVRVEPIESGYLEGLAAVRERRDGKHLLVLFLGSTIGNFERPVAQDFLRLVRELLQPGDALLLAADLEKSVEQLLRAYDDPLGVTAAFNLNLLARINRELGADFDLARFRHEARWNQAERRVEMHACSLEDQTVTIPAADLVVELKAGETLWTESSHKFNTAEVARMGAQAGFACVEQWVDREWPYTQTLLVAP